MARTDSLPVGAAADTLWAPRRAFTIYGLPAVAGGSQLGRLLRRLELFEGKLFDLSNLCAEIAQALSLCSFKRFLLFAKRDLVGRWVVIPSHLLCCVQQLIAVHLISL